MNDIEYEREEEEEQEEFEDIPTDSLWAYYHESTYPLDYVYFGGKYRGTKPIFLVYPIWRDRLNSRLFSKQAKMLRELSFEDFWRLEGEGLLVRVDDPAGKLARQ